METNPRVHSGAPVLRGTRMPVDAIIGNFDYGMTVGEISQQFELPPSQVEAIVAYAQGYRIARPVR